MTTSSIKRPLLAMAVAATLAAAPGAPAQAAPLFKFFTSGSVGPTDPACNNPFAGCQLTAIGIATALSGSLVPLPGPWDFEATFSLVQPLGAGLFRTTGTFEFDDTSPANDDLSGNLDGVFNAATFTNTMTYIVTGGSGRFAGLEALGGSVITINPQTFQFTEDGTIGAPAPVGLLLAAAVVAAWGSSRRRSGAAKKG